MHWRKCDLWKAGIIVAGAPLLLLLMTWVPLSTVSAHEGISGVATPGTVTMQATPTEDATVTALNKEKLAQEVQQFKEQNEPDLFGWLRANASILLSTLVVVTGGLIGLGRWLADRRSEREKRTEERFQAAVTGLGDDKEGVRISAAILLRTFLRPGYEQFYTQIFDLAVAHLRLPRTPNPPERPDDPLPLTPLSQALSMVFKEAFPLARSLYPTGRQPLVARGIRLDSAYLEEADLKQVWMPQASLQRADLSEADLSEADLSEANLNTAKLSGTKLSGTKLSGTKLRGTDLSGAYLSRAELSRTYFSGAKLSGADLRWSNLSSTELTGTDLSGADLSGTNLSEAYLNGANLNEANLTGANLEEALYLKDASLRGVKGLTKEQLAACKAKGAIIDEDLTASSTQPTVAPPPPSQSNDEQTSSAPLAQGNLPTPDTDGSSAVSLKPDSES